MISNQTKKKHTIQIPNDIKVFYCQMNKIMCFVASGKQSYITIHDLLSIHFHKQKIEITNTINLSHGLKKQLKIIIANTISKITQTLIQLISIIYQKLQLVGVGYKAIPVTNFENQLLSIKLGYTHFIYFKIPSEIKVVSLKFTKLFLVGHSLQQLTHVANQIRLKKNQIHTKVKEFYIVTKKSH
jgi:ribosomal protein L6P/L9E